MIHRRSWKEFKGVAARRVPDSFRASISTEGEITFDIKAFRALGEPQAVLLFYERSTRTIGLKRAHPDASNAVLVRVRHERSSRIVRSMPFFHENGIEIDQPLRIPYPYIEDNVLILDLRTAVSSALPWKRIKGTNRAVRRTGRSSVVR